MTAPNILPCPVRSGVYFEDIIQDALARALTQAARSSEGDLVGIAQSWSVRDGVADRHPSFGYWLVDCDGLLQPKPYRSLSREHHGPAGVATAQLLDNIHARSAIAPVIEEMAKINTLACWYDAIHTADGIFLFDDNLRMDELTSAARCGRLAGAITYLAHPGSSQHRRVEHHRNVEAFLRGLTGRLMGRYPDENDRRLGVGIV